MYTHRLIITHIMNRGMIGISPCEICKWDWSCPGHQKYPGPKKTKIKSDYYRIGSANACANFSEGDDTGVLA